MDTFVDSSWYYMRYCDPTNVEKMVAEGTQYWMGAGNSAGTPGMDQYIGGIEHAILHLLYARFWTKVMRDLKLVAIDEPFTHLLTQGMVLNEAFVRSDVQGAKHYFWADELDIVRDEHAAVVSATAKVDGQGVACEGWTTMSKSKNNGVDTASCGASGHSASATRRRSAVPVRCPERPSSAQPRGRCGARSTACCARSATTTSACSTTPWSPAR